MRFVAPEEESSEESPCGDQLIRGVFTIIQRSGFPLKGGQALLTFEEEKGGCESSRWRWEMMTCLNCPPPPQWLLRS